MARPVQAGPERRARGLPNVDRLRYRNGSDRTKPDQIEVPSKPRDRRGAPEP